ncbi:MAG TPA: DUF748 domain-containing protein [Polyangiales bacterium]|nr:DUF748 domain-containing protein [Polyangiales bacterium]
MSIKRVLRWRALWILAAIAVLVIGLHLALPSIVLRYVNEELDGLDGYAGHVEDIDISLLRGAYQIQGVRIVKSNGRVPVPFFTADEIDISVEWSALFDGDIVAEIDVHRPMLNFVKGPTEKTSQTEPGDNWTETVRDLAPFKINRFAILDGSVHYRDFHSEPKVNIYAQNIRAVARNLTNAEDLSGSLVATFEAKALAMSSGAFELNGKYNPYTKQPTFEVDAKLNRLNIKQLNSFLKAYAKVDAERGKISIDTEIAASKGRFRGYVKPFIDDLQILDWDKENEGFLGKIWEGVVEVAGEILEDQDKDRIATRVPLRGSVDDPEADIWSTIGGVLKNAFLEALRRGIEHKVGTSEERASKG